MAPQHTATSPPNPANGAPALAGAPLTPRSLGWELGCVLALSVGAAAVSAVISLIGALTAPESLSEQTASLVQARADAQRPWLDLSRQLFSVIFALVPVVLALHLLHRSHDRATSIGFDLRRPGRDLGGGLVLAGAIGAGGLAVYLLSWQLGLSRPITPSALNEHWWQLPVLVLQAVKNGVLEEVIVVGYLLHRFGQLGTLLDWSPLRTALTATALSSGLRAVYHLYQGVGMAMGNLVMGGVFCWLYYRYGRVMPLVVAHTVIDIVAFVGAVHLIGVVSWLPGG